MTGYPGGNDIMLALERGEVQGRCNCPTHPSSTRVPAWVKERKINVINQFADEKHPELPDVPLITELVTSEKQRQMIELAVDHAIEGAPVRRASRVPEERIAALRKAFDDTMKDPAFLEMAKIQQLEIEPVQRASHSGKPAERRGASPSPYPRNAGRGAGRRPLGPWTSKRRL